MASSKDKLMKGSAAMNKILSGAVAEPQEEQETTEKPTAKKTTKKTAKADTGQAVKPEKVKQKVFSFRAEENKVDQWRVQAVARGITVNELGEKAIDEYIKRHKLTEDQQQLFDLTMAQKKS